MHPENTRYGKRCGITCHYYDSLPSTNVTAFELAQNGGVHGEVISAAVQTAGRGRLGKSWQSPSGRGLYFSIIVRPKMAPQQYPYLTMTTGLALATAIEKLCGIPVALKWPNDIYISGKKCGGILAEAALSGSNAADYFAIIGVGLNIVTREDEFPRYLRAFATSLHLETGKWYDLEEVFCVLHAGILHHINELQCYGFNRILEKWKRHDCLKGKWLNWVTSDGEVIHAQSQGPDERGRLVVRDGSGRVHTVISGDVRVADRQKGF
ncbi:MAG: biotin--[acetyl-CoA-carboxylase] ligase [Desulfopila sp.]